MQTALIILNCIFGISIIVSFYILITRKPQQDNSVNELVQKMSSSTDTSLSILRQQLQSIETTVHDRLQSSENRLNENFRLQSRDSNTIIESITEKLSRLDETNKQVMSFTDQLRSFQDILKNPKQRGTILGEYYLETILQRVLPPKTYQIQYAFNNGDLVDAVIFVNGKIIPVDSKFSLDNYNRIVESNSSGSDTDKFVAEFKRDIKTRIDETAKYIRPNENTLEFAFMFIPHEAIYYDLLVAEIGSIKINTQDLVQYAFSKKVIIVSPTSFLAYLQTVMQGLRALQIEESAREIRKNVEELQKHLQAYGEYFGKIGTSLSTVVNHFNTSNREFQKIDRDVVKITGNTTDISIPQVEKPYLET